MPLINISYARQGAQVSRANYLHDTITGNVAPGQTRFEKLAASLGLTEAEWSGSPVLKRFAERNCNRWFVPEKLLSGWGIHVYIREV